MDSMLFMKYSSQNYLEYENKMQREGLFELISQNYKIDRAIYPGSFIHISPSFYFREVVYVDTDKNAKKFFDDKSFEKIISQKKVYSEDFVYRYHPVSYSSKLSEEEQYFDLLISQYAGFISQECKKYLKINGILVANNSHGDAQLANINPDYEFIGVINYQNKKFTFSQKYLEDYFIPKKEGLKISMEYLKSINHGIGYKKIANHYLFKRIK